MISVSKTSRDLIEMTKLTYQVKRDRVKKIIAEWKICIGGSMKNCHYGNGYIDSFFFAILPSREEHFKAHLCRYRGYEYKERVTGDGNKDRVDGTKMKCSLSLDLASDLLTIKHDTELCKQSELIPHFAKMADEPNSSFKKTN